MPRTRLRSPSSALRPSRRVVGGAIPQTLRRRLSWIAVPTALAALGSGIVVNVVAPRYTGEATILIEGHAPGDGLAMANQIQAATSRDVAKDAVRRLKLVGNPEFDPAAGGIGPAEQVMMLLGILANPLDRPSEDRVIEGFLDRLRVVPGNASRTLSVAFDSTDAGLAAEAANTVARLSLASTASGRAGAGPDAQGGAEAADALRRRVAEAEAKVEAYRARHGLAAATMGQPTSTPQMTELANQLTQARLAQAEIAGRVAAIREMLKDGRAYEIGDVATTDTLRRMIDSRITTRAQLALESRTLLPAHPRIKELKAQLADLDGQIKTAAERAVLVLENDGRTAEGRVASLQAAVDGKRGAVKGTPEPTEIMTLERSAKTLREELDTVLNRPNDLPTPLAEGAGAPALLIAQAVTPTVPSFPDKWPIVGFTTLLAFLVSLGGVLARALLGRSLPTRRAQSTRPAAERPQTEGERTAAALLASNPFALPEASPPGHWDDAGPVHAAAMVSAPAPAVTEPTNGSAFELAPLLARLSRRIVPGTPCGRTIVVVDDGMAASGALHAALAVALGRTGSVIAVDLGGPSSAEAGFTDVVGGHAAFADVIQPGGPGGAHRVGTGHAETELLFEEPRALAFTLEAMAEAYGWVLCRLHRGPDMADLLALVATLSDSVVIASDADPADPALGDLYGIATEAGAGQVLIAQDRPALSADGASPRTYDLAA